MDRFFYYTLGIMAAVLVVAFGVVFYSQNSNMLRGGMDVDSLDSTSVPFDASPSPTATPPGSAINPAGMTSQMASTIPVQTPTPVQPAIPWTPPDPGQMVTAVFPGFTVVYSLTLGSPIAVQYALVNGAKPKKYPEIARVKTPDRDRITSAGFLPGPMALPLSIELYFGKEAAKNTSSMVNTAAFFPGALAGPWSQFGGYEKRWAGESGWIEMVAGPIFSNPPRQTADGLVVPSAFFRVYRRSFGDTLAFIVPQAATSVDLTDYLTSVAAVEGSTGLRIFSDTILPAMRNVVAKELW